jgi:hypothetical protein
MLQIEDAPVGVTFLWTTKNVHLRVGGVRQKDGHGVFVPMELDETGHRWLAVVVEELWWNLDAYLAQIEARVKAGTALINIDAIWPKKGPISGTAAEEWLAFLDSRALRTSRSQDG